MGTKRRVRFVNGGPSKVETGNKAIGNGINSVELRELSVENQYLADLQAALRTRRLK